MPHEFPSGPLLSSKSYWRDRLFFADRPNRKFRVRAPLLKELRRARRNGALSALAAGQCYIVIVSRLDGAITTILAKARLAADGSYPDTDDEISQAFALGAGGRP